MARRINVKLILENRSAGLSTRLVCFSRPLQHHGDEGYTLVFVTKEHFRRFFTPSTVLKAAC